MKEKHHRWSLWAAQAVLGVLIGIASLMPARLRAASLVEIAAGNADFSTLVAAVQAAGLVETLSGAGPFTVFAPNNAAFAKLPPGTVQALLADPAKLRQVLLYHVVPGRVRSTDLKAGPLVTAQGAAARVSLTGGVKIDNATVLAADLEASNGVVHVIDTVILPPPTLVEIAAGNADFSTLVAAVQAAGLVETLSGAGPFTVFAPNNAAFAKLPPGTVQALLADPAKLRQVLLYHVVPGRVRSTDLKAGPLMTAQGAAARVSLTGGVRIDNATVLAADLEASNGVIHVIDTVILPPPTLVEIAAGSADFSTLVTAVQAAGLTDLFRPGREFTVLAPNNAAFAKLPPGTVQALLADTNRLRTILLYHLLPGRVRSTDLQAGKAVTIQGAALNVALTNGVTFNSSRVVGADVEAADGVIHVLDTVLLPPPSILEIAAANPNFSTLVTAVQAAGLVEVLDGPGPFTVFAPDNAAFAKLPAGTVQALLADTNRLRHILLYHLNHGPRLRSTDLASGTIPTLHGAPARIVVDGSGVKVNQATVQAADVEAVNGIIHVLDSVILPATGFDGLALSVIAKDGQSTVVWPVLSAGPAPALEQAPTPAGPWTRVTGPVTTADGVNKVQVEATDAAGFFRLVRP